MAASELSCACVAGTLPRSLLAALSSAGGNVAAYLSSALPSTEVNLQHPHKASATHTVSADANTALFAVFEDATVCSRWSVELEEVRSTADGNATGQWRVDRNVLASIDEALVAHMTPSGADHGSSNAAPDAGPLPITAARYLMREGTWTVTALSPTKQKSCSTLASLAPSRSTAHDIDDEKSYPGPSHVTDPQELSQAPLASSSSSLLLQLTLPELVQRHRALVLRLVQLLSPQRRSTAHLVRELCRPVTTSSPAAPCLLCEVHADTEGSGAELQSYTPDDLAAVVELLTDSYPRQPKLRELRSEGYLLLDLAKFPDGETRNKAVNRAYPALAMHWPESAQLMDTIERYVDRDIVLRTRKRHPELSARIQDDDRQRKRDRSSSSDVSPTSEVEKDEMAKQCITTEETPEPGGPAVGASKVATSQDGTPTSRASASRCRFQSLRDYPQSLELGDLQAWSRGPDAQRLRDSWEVAVALSQKQSSPLSSPAQPATDGSVSLSSLPVRNQEDVSVLRAQYDALSEAEGLLLQQLIAYRDTVQELRSWYREELCSAHFRFELGMWLQAQEESRVALTNLYTNIHKKRYSMERDLSDYLHLHALGVL